MVDEVRRPFTALHVGLVAIFLLLTGSLFRMQVVEGDYYRRAAEENRERVIPLKPSRGIIYDRNGGRLVVNNPSYSIAVTAADVPDINCSAALEPQVQEALVFDDLAAILNDNRVPVNYVLAVQPAEFPVEKFGEIANRLSVPLQTHKDIVRASLSDTLQTHQGSENTFPIRKDVAPEAAEAIEAQLDHMPGVRVYNELELNFITRFSGCLSPVIVKRNVDYETMLKVEAKRAELPGMSIVSEPVRQYTDGALFSHILGYVGPISREEYEVSTDTYAPDDKVGQTGVESALEAALRGEKGVASVVVNSRERKITEIAVRQPITGNNVALTLDVNLQRAVAAALQDGINKAKVNAGVAIVLNVNNGQVLSMVSLPSYDNNLFSAGISQKDFDTLTTDSALPMFNRAVGGAYPPGSTYKMITAAAALQEGVVTPNTIYDCPGFIEVPHTWNEKSRNKFRDWKASGHGKLNVVQALTVSSDVFFYIVAGPRQEDRVIHKDDGTDETVWTRFYRPWAKKPDEFHGLGIERLDRYAQAFGFGQKTGIELPTETAGLAPDREWKVSTFPDNPWSMGDTLVTAIGQGYNLVTPLQLVNAVAAVANGGTLHKPQLVLRTTDWQGNVVQEYQPQALGQLPVSPENLAIVHEGMRQVVMDRKGTAYQRITLRSIPWAGKTGTAEFGDPIKVEDGKETRRSHAWFTAFAPFDKPEIAVVVLLEGGQESLEGSTFAVPVTDAIMKAYFGVEK